MTPDELSAITERAPGDRDSLEVHWEKRCGCGACFSRAEWDALAAVGTMPSDVETHDLLLKNCTNCHSTISVYVPKELP